MRGAKPPRPTCPCTATSKSRAVRRAQPPLAEARASTFGGSTRLNHNETSLRDNSAEEATPKAPVDLPLQSDEQIKGGASGTGTSGGSTRLNHNETALEDDDAEEAAPKAPADLPVQLDEQIKGGPSGSSTSSGSTRLNHNETLRVDQG